ILSSISIISIIYFFNATPPTDIYTLSLHDALPISRAQDPAFGLGVGVWLRRRNGCARFDDHADEGRDRGASTDHRRRAAAPRSRSEEHTPELQSRGHLVCRLLLEKKNKRKSNNTVK